MASALLSYLQALWPLCALLREEDDLRASAWLVGSFFVPEETKQFVLELRVPGGSPQDRGRDGAAVIYILAAQNLSEQSASDAERLNREVRPRAVVTQVARPALEDVRIEEDCLARNGGGGVPVLASPFQVIMQCVTEKRSKDQYVKAAACQVLQEILGSVSMAIYLLPRELQRRRDRVFHFLSLHMRGIVAGLDRAAGIVLQTITQLSNYRPVAR